MEEISEARQTVITLSEISSSYMHCIFFLFILLLLFSHFVFVHHLTLELPK